MRTGGKKIRKATNWCTKLEIEFAAGQYQWWSVHLDKTFSSQMTVWMVFSIIVGCEISNFFLSFHLNLRNFCELNFLSCIQLLRKQPCHLVACPEHLSFISSHGCFFALLIQFFYFAYVSVFIISSISLFITLYDQINPQSDWINIGCRLLLF